MTNNNYNDDAFISASTIVDADCVLQTNLENKNSVAYSCPELFY